MTERYWLPELRIEGRILAGSILWCLTLIAAIVLTSRALVGAFVTPVSMFIPVIATGLSLTTSLAGWRLVFTARRDDSSILSDFPIRLVAGCFSFVAPAAIAFSTCANASPTCFGAVTGLLILGVTVGILDQGIPDGLLAGSSSGESEPSVATPNINPASGGVGNTPSLQSFTIVDPHSRATSEFSAGTREECEAEADHEPDNQRVIQQVTRCRELDGSERIEAVIQATFAAGERETVVHFPIHPVLMSSPQVECEPLDESEVTIQVASSMPYGLRLEVKRDAPAEQLTIVPIGIEVWASGESSADVA